MATGIGIPGMDMNGPMDGSNRTIIPGIEITGTKIIMITTTGTRITTIITDRTIGTKIMVGGKITGTKIMVGGKTTGTRVMAAKITGTRTIQAAASNFMAAAEVVADTIVKLC
jgi:hypothetical protein